MNTEETLERMLRQQGYVYIGRDHQPVLARDLEDRLIATEAAFEQFRTNSARAMEAAVKELRVRMAELEFELKAKTAECEIADETIERLKARYVPDREAVARAIYEKRGGGLLWSEEPSEYRKLYLIHADAAIAAFAAMQERTL